jgi:hypothetical protein
VKNIPLLNLCPFLLRLILISTAYLSETYFNGKLKTFKLK